MASPSRSWSVASSSSSTDFSGVAQLGDLALLLRRDDVERGELVVDVHPEPRPRLALVLGRHVGRAARQVPDVPDGGLDDVVLAQVLGDLLGLRGGLDDDQAAGRMAVRGGGGRAGSDGRHRPSCGSHRFSGSCSSFPLPPGPTPSSTASRLKITTAATSRPWAIGYGRLRAEPPTSMRAVTGARTPNLTFAHLPVVPHPPRVASGGARHPRGPDLCRESVTRPSRCRAPPVAWPVARRDPGRGRTDQFDQPGDPAGPADPQRRRRGPPGPAACPAGWPPRSAAGGSAGRAGPGPAGSRHVRPAGRRPAPTSATPPRPAAIPAAPP